MANDTGLQELRTFIDRNRTKVDLILDVLALAGFSDRSLDYVSDGLWTQKRSLIGFVWQGPK